jgi:hypothetical protein
LNKNIETPFPKKAKKDRHYPMRILFLLVNTAFLRLFLEAKKKCLTPYRANVYQSLLA